MALTPQQARMKAMQLRTLKPELRNMAIEDLTAQIMASEGAQDPGAGGGTLADLFPPKTLSAASPAPMAAARFQAAKPTAAIIPAAGAAGVDSYREAQKIRARTEKGPTPEERAAANGRVQSLMAELPKPAVATTTPEVTPVRAASPVAAALAAAEAPAKATYRSRFRPMLEQAEADLKQMNEQMALNTTSGGKPDPDLAFNLKIKSSEVSRLKGMVAAEEGAVVDTERAALLERQASRLGREEELVEKARKRAPFDALIAGGAALGSARPGESFTSALTRGLAAGNESYGGALDAREKALRGIEEKRDTFTIQKMDALDSARNKAIELANAGVAMTKEEIALINSRGEGALADELRPFKVSVAESEAKTAGVSAQYADQLARLEVRKGEAEITLRNAQAWNARNPGAGNAALADAVKPSATVYAELSDGVNLLTKIAADRLGSTPEARAAALAELPAAKAQLAAYGRLLGIGGAAPAAPAAPIPRVAPNGRSYIPDPNRPGKYLEVVK